MTMSSHKPTELLPIILSFSCFVILTSVLFAHIDRGLILTDDSYYILLARQPQNVDGSISQFGYFTHLLYLAADENLARFRMFGAVLLLAVSLVFAWFFTQHTKAHSSLGTMSTVLLIASAGIAYYFWRWYPTPSYNWMNLIGCQLVASGLLGFLHNKKIIVLIAGLLVGLGGALSFFAKPPTAALLLLIMCWWLFSHRRSHPLYLFFISACISCFGLLIWHIHFVLGGMDIFIESIRQGMAYSVALQSGHNLLSIIKLVAKGIGIPIVCGVLLSLIFYKFFSIRAIDINDKQALHNRISLSIFSVTIFILLLLPISPGSMPAPGFMTLIVSYLFFYWFIKKQTDTGITTKDNVYLQPAILMLLIAITYPVGSDWHFEKLLSGGLILLVPACLLLASLYDTNLEAKKLTITTVSFIVIIFMLQLYSEYNAPLRVTGSLKQQSTVVFLYDIDDQIFVDPESARYIRGLKAKARAADWQVRTPLIDMTGFSPGALVILDAKVLSRPWFLGTYPGTEDYALRALSRADKGELERAWILTAPDGYANLDEKLLMKAGLDFPASYTLIAEVTTSYRREKQQLWRPD